MSASDMLDLAEKITGTLDILVADAREFAHDVGDNLAEIYEFNRRGDLRGRLDGVCETLKSVENARKELEDALEDAMFDAYCLAQDLADEAAKEEEQERAALLREYWAGVI